MMTSRERWLAAVHMQPVDRLPFWPKIGGSYAAAQPPPYQQMSGEELHAFVGSDQHLYLPSVTREVTHDASREEIRQGDDYQISAYEIGGHRMELHQQYDKASTSWHPMRFPCQTVEDLEAMTAWYRAASYELVPEQVTAATARKAAIGQQAICATGIGESPLMYFIEYLAGVEMAHYFLADEEARVEALFDALHQHLRRNVELVCAKSPADLFYMVENTSTTLISPAQYQRYCFAHLSEYADIASACGKAMVLHMCGHLKLLLPQLNKLPVRAFEAFTSPTVGNTTLRDGREGCPETCLIGGTNASLWLRPADEIIARIKRDLDELPHHRGIVITSAGVMPPACKPETIRAVAEWVRAYPVRN